MKTTQVPEKQSQEKNDSSHERQRGGQSDSRPPDERHQRGEHSAFVAKDATQLTGAECPEAPRSLNVQDSEPPPGCELRQGHIPDRKRFLTHEKRVVADATTPIFQNEIYGKYTKYKLWKMVKPQVLARRRDPCSAVTRIRRYVAQVDRITKGVVGAESHRASLCTQTRDSCIKKAQPTESRVSHNVPIT